MDSVTPKITETDETHVTAVTVVTPVIHFAFVANNKRKERN